MHWLVLCGIPYRGRGVLPHLTQRTSLTSFPLPSWGRPQGHREASLLICNFQRVAHATPYCKLSSRSLPACRFRLRCNFPRIATMPPDCKRRSLWKAAGSVGNARLNASQSTPNPSTHSRNTAWPAPPAKGPSRAPARGCRFRPARGALAPHQPAPNS